MQASHPKAVAPKPAKERDAVANDRANITLGGAYAGIVTGFLTLVILGDICKSSHQFHDYVNLAAYIGTVVGVTALSSRQDRPWQTVNKRRQMAAAYGFAAGVPLAAKHPLPNVGALQLPCVIRLKTNWLQVLSLFCLLSGLGVLYGWLFQFWLIPIAAGVLLIKLLYPQQIIVTLEGVIVRHALFDWLNKGWQFRKQDMLWGEAKLFAIRDSKPGSTITRYELSSRFCVVQWGHVRQTRWWSLYRPASDFRASDEQMEALIAVISGYTGLPLYDLREDTPLAPGMID